MALFSQGNSENSPSSESMAIHADDSHEDYSQNIESHEQLSFDSERRSCIRTNQVCPFVSYTEMQHVLRVWFK